MVETIKSEGIVREVDLWCEFEGWNDSDLGRFGIGSSLWRGCVSPRAVDGRNEVWRV